MTRVILAILLVLTLVGVSYEINAKGQTYQPYDVVCATLAFNAGYETKGKVHADRVEPYYKANEKAIRYISGQVVRDLAEHAMLEDRTLPYVARKVYKYYCVGRQEG